jgi:oligopeptide transport system substrate-binding protein
MFNKKTGLLVAIFVLLAVLAACQPETVEVTRVVTEEVTRVVTDTVEVEGEQVEVTRIVTEEVEVTRVVEAEEEGVSAEGPITLNMVLNSEPPTLDPALATDTTSVDLIRNLFVTLTQFDPVTGEVLPYLATEWTEGTDDQGRQTWTFTIREDIPWVAYNPATGEATVATDADGNELFVTAEDVVYGVKRTLDPATASTYAYVLYNVANGAAVNAGEEGLTIDDLGVAAPDATTVVFTLENPAPYFPGIAAMWIAAPQPAAAIAERPERWIEPGFIVTNGPYVLDTWVHGSEVVLVKNPHWVDADSVQIERVEMPIILEESTEFALYENNELDTAGVPLPELDRVKADPVLSAEFVNAPDPCTYYYGFTNNKPPFDDVRVRRAFVQSVDRQSLIDNVIKGGQVPATSFAPPGVFGAPEPGTVGLQYDPEAAQASLQEFLDEQGLTVEEFNETYNITLMYNTSEAHALIAAAVQQMWQDTLGVTVNVENQEWQVYLDTIEKTTPLAEHPHIWRLGWCADYLDENNWVHENFNVNAGSNDLRRACNDENCTAVTPTEFDALTEQAQQSSDPEERTELYREAERILAEEEVAYLPIYHYTIVQVTKPWLTRNYAPLGGIDIFNWTIDWDAKLEAAQ